MCVCACATGPTALGNLTSVKSVFMCAQTTHTHTRTTTTTTRFGFVHFELRRQNAQWSGGKYLKGLSFDPVLWVCEMERSEMMNGVCSESKHRAVHLLTFNWIERFFFFVEWTIGPKHKWRVFIMICHRHQVGIHHTQHWLCSSEGVAENACVGMWGMRSYPKRSHVLLQMHCNISGRSKLQKINK